MNLHQNALMGPRGRERMARLVVDHGLSLRAAARAFDVDPKTVQRWVQRFQEAGRSGLVDRSSRPRSQPRRTPRRIQRQVVALRRQRWTMDRIATFTRISRASVSRILRREGLNRLSALEPAEPPRRYEHEHPGDLLHLDIKKLARFRHPGHRVTGVRAKDSIGAGYEYVHVAIDDRSRIAYSEIHPAERAQDAIAHLEAAVRYYATLGITIRRVLTDNGPCYHARAFSQACRRLGIRHRRTRPYTPRTNGKAERFIQTALREWAYAFTYATSEERKRHLPRWIHDYNWHRPHGSLNKQPPISVLGLPEDNLVRLH
ncbi:IS481 family transposase, partial [Thioalkalivibrio sp. ALE31]